MIIRAWGVGLCQCCRGAGFVHPLPKRDDSVLVGDMGDVGREALAEVSRARLALGGRVSSRCSTFMLGRAFCFLRAAAAVFYVGLTSIFTPALDMGTGTPWTFT